MPEPLSSLLADPPAPPVTVDLGPLVRRRVRRKRAALGGGAGAVALGLGGAAVLALPGGGRPAPSVLLATPAAPAAVSTGAAASGSPGLTDAEIVAEFLPATGAETQPGRFARLLDRAQTQAVDACRQSRGLAAQAPAAQVPFHDHDLPDLRLIAADGLSSQVAGPAPGVVGPPPCVDASSAATTAGDRVESSAIGSTLRVDWQKVIVAADADPQVLTARAGLGACFAAHGVVAASEDAFLGYVDGALQRVGAADFHTENVRLGGIYAACMAPVEGRRAQVRLAARPGFLAAHAADVGALEGSVRAAAAEITADTGLTLDAN